MRKASAALGLYPATHPYGHSVIGSMTDLDAASLDDVKGWFRNHYGPNNAVLVLAGDVDLATARRLVEKTFGAIASGPKTVKRVVGPAGRLGENEAANRCTDPRPPDRRWHRPFGFT